MYCNRLLRNGLIIQWVSATVSGSVTWNFPIQFSKEPFVWKGYLGNSSTSLQWGEFSTFAITSLSTTLATFGGIGSVFTKVYAFAIGY